MLRFYSAADVHAALEFAPLADALARAFAQGAEVPLRHGHALGGDDRLLLMPAWSPAALGIKLVTVMPENAARGARTVHALYVLCDRTTGEPRAVLDGAALTLRRTAAASALAARYLARADADTLLLVGPANSRRTWRGRTSLCGRRCAACWSGVAMPGGRAPPSTRCLPTACRQRRWPRYPRRQAARQSCAAPRPRANRWCGARGLRRARTSTSSAPSPRRCARSTTRRCALARVVVDTYRGALAEAGDLVQPLQAGVIAREHVVAELAELVRGERAGRQSAAQITLFKSVGTALEDLAAAQLVVERSS